MHLYCILSIRQTNYNCLYTGTSLSWSTSESTSRLVFDLQHGIGVSVINTSKLITPFQNTLPNDAIQLHKDDFVTWKAQVQPLLVANGLWRSVNGSAPIPVTIVSEFSNDEKHFWYHFRYEVWNLAITRLNNTCMASQ